MQLFESIDLIDGRQEHRLLHQDEMVVGFDLHDGVDHLFHMEDGRGGPYGNEIALTPMLIGSKAGGHGHVFAEDATAVEPCPRHEGADLFKGRLRVCGNKQVQRIDPQT